MASEFTQDAVLVFLQSRGGTVKNSDLVLHFKNFIRDHADQDRNRELFKKFVNSVATVKQLDGVSHVILRKKFRGYVPGKGAEVGSSDPPCVPVGKNAETAAPNKPRQKPQQKEATAPAPSGETATKTILPVAGLVLTNNNSVQENLNLRQQQVHQSIQPVTAQVVSHSPQTPQLKTPSLPTPPALDQASKVGQGQRRVGFGPPPGVTPAPPHRATSPGSEVLTGQRQPEVGVHAQRAPRRAGNRPSYKTAVSQDDEEEKEEEITVTQISAGGTRPPSALLNAPGRVTPAPSSGQKSYSQGTEGQMLTPRSPTRVIPNNSNFDLRQQQAHSAPDHSVRPVSAQTVSHIPQKPQLKTPSLPTPPAPDQASKGGELRGGLHGLHQEPPVPPQLTQRRLKHRQSYKTAVSYDEDDVEEVPMRRGSGGGAWPLNVPLGDTVRAMSSSSPCIIDTPAPSSVPQIYIQGAEGEKLSPHYLGLREETAGPRLELGETTRRSLPLETALHHNIQQGHQYSPLSREPKPGTNQSDGPLMSSSHSSIYSPSSAGGFHSTKWPPSNSTRELGWTSSSSDLQIRAGTLAGLFVNVSWLEACQY